MSKRDDSRATRTLRRINAIRDGNLAAGLSRTALALLWFYITSTSKDDGTTAWGGPDRIAAYIGGVSPGASAARVVRKARSELARAGLIVITDARGGVRNGHGMSAEVRLTIPGVDADQPGTPRSALTPPNPERTVPPSTDLPGTKRATNPERFVPPNPERGAPTNPAVFNPAVNPAVCAQRKRSAPKRDASPVVMSLPTKGGKFWDLTESRLAELVDRFDTDRETVLREMRKAVGWLNDFPARRKTPDGMPRFVSGWLGRADLQADAQGDDDAHLPDADEEERRYRAMREREPTPDRLIDLKSPLALNGGPTR